MTCFDSPTAAALVWLVVGTAAAEPEPAVIDETILRSAARAAEKNPNVMAAQLDYAALLRTLFRLDEARQWAAAASQLSAERPEPWIELARIEILAGRRGAAGSHAQRAARLDGSSAGPGILAGLTAAVRIGSARSKALAADSPAIAAAAMLDAALARDYRGLATRVEWKPAATSPAGLAAGYSRYLEQIAGARWIGYELVAGPEPGLARAYLLWRVTPSKADVEALNALPAGYRAALPLSWLTALAATAPELRDGAVRRARAASWTEVTTLDLTVVDGKVLVVRSAGGDLMAEALNAPAVDLGAPAVDLGAQATVSTESDVVDAPSGQGDSPGRRWQLALAVVAFVVAVLGAIALFRRRARRQRGGQDR